MIQVRPVDWAALTLLALEVPSLGFSQDRANSIHATEVAGLSVTVYFALRLLLHASLRAAWLAALVGLGGAWLASRGIDQFASDAGQIAVVGLTDLVAFRSSLIHPISGWVPGECFTVILLTLPFACAAGVYVWRKGAPGPAILALLPAMPLQLRAKIQTCPLRQFPLRL
jgi:hypothetical protein